VPRYQRLKNEHIQPVDAPISRAKARELLIDYLMQVTSWPRPTAEYSAFEFDTSADEQEQKLDESFESATSNASLEVEMATEEVADLTAELNSDKLTAKERSALQSDLEKARKQLARYQAVIDKAEARRSAGKSDYRKLLIRAANKIVSEEERM
jgi:hypothetical protein